MDDHDTHPASAEHEAFTGHWVRAQPILTTYLISVVNHRQDEEDLLQQVALSASKHFHRYDPSRPFNAWVMTIARNKVVDYYRNRGRRKMTFSVELLDQLAQDTSRQEELLTAQKRALRRCLGKLPDRSRRMIRLRYTDGQTLESIASGAGLTTKSLYVALHRIRKKLADCIKLQLSSEERA